MPVPPLSSISLRLPDDPDEWTRVLRQQGVSPAEFVHAFSLLGSLTMLEERDASEIAGLEFEGRAWEELPVPPWAQAWEEKQYAGLNAWWHSYKASVHHWPTRTQALRQRMSLRSHWPVQLESATALAARVIQCFKPSQKQTFAGWFQEHFRLLLWGIGEHRSDGLSLASYPMQLLLRDLAAIQPHHRVLLAGGENIHLLNELLDRLARLARYTPANQLTNMARHGVTVSTGSASFAEQALALLLAHEVEQPDVVLEAPNLLNPEPVYDWVIAAPPWGAVMPEDQTDVPVPSRRVESVVLQRALAGLLPTGRLIAWMPRSLARNGSDQSLRRWLVDHQQLHAVAELPSDTATGTATRVTSLLLLLSRGHTANACLFVGEPLVKRCLEDADFAPTQPQLNLLSLLLRTAMGAVNDADLTALREDSKKVNPAYAEERAEMLALARGLANLSSPPPKIGRLSELRTGIVPRDSWEEHDVEFTWPRDLQGDLKRSLHLLVAAKPQLRLTTLEEVADCSKGIAYTRERTLRAAELREREPNELVGLIRVSDLTRKVDSDAALPLCQPPTLLLTPQASSEVRERQLLRPWDILLSGTGTVDKVSVFAEEERRCVASHSIIIIRPKLGMEEKTIRHIVGILRSKAGMAWLQGLATGSVIQHLVLRDLKSMPMIDGPDEILDAIGEHLLQGHPLETAISVFDDRLRQDPTLAFFSECEAMRATFAPESAKAVEAWLGRLSWSLQTWKDSFNEAIPKGGLHDWWIEVDALVHRLLEALRTNPGYDRLTLLLFWQHAFLESEKALASAVERITQMLEDSTAPNADELQKDGITHRGKTLLRRMGELAATEIGRQCQPVKLHVTLEPQEVTVATQTVVTVELGNLSPLSLQDVMVSVNEGRNHAKMLACADGLKLPVIVHATNAGPLPIRVQWKARTLDGREFNGVIEEQVNVVSLRTASTAVQQNPYVDGGSPVGGKDEMFYGRKEALHRMDQAFSRGNRTTVLIVEGNRRIGKSSLLLYYRTHRLDLAKWLPVDINFQRFPGASGGTKSKSSGIPDRRIFQGIAKKVLEAASDSGLAVPIAGLGHVSAGLPTETKRLLLRDLETFFNEGAPFERFLHILEAALSVLGEKRLLFMFDEFDLIQSGIDSGVTGSQVPENFRNLLQDHPQLAAILTGSLKIRRLRQQYWNVLFNLGQSLQLRGLEPAEAAELVTQPVHGHLAYSPEAVTEIVRLTGRQPLLIQTLCGRLFDMSTDRHAVLISLEMVREAAQEQIEDSETFARLWDDIGNSRRQALVLVLEQMARDEQAVRPVLLREQAEESGLRFESLQQLKADLDALKDQDVLSSTINDQVEDLAFEVPLFALWLRRHQDFAAVCAEVAESDESSPDNHDLL
ncbi:N-6 DNA methylase [Prosthecobacter fusiformis]|uniref:N-6 DNA methylase n=1 Tax=Prosthecobacter fusiformis TaxID=48464 RepID=A0A4R7STK1_9BACT|nr:N-6 DNA methylase [Prosthecobacter fusiformis]TDU81617.1 N-6 DNA methylase [Prosthecobacter fusiformis]